MHSTHIPPARDLAPLFQARRSALTGAIPLRHPNRRELEPDAEPVFFTMVREWGCPLVGVPWTGRRPTWPLEGRVLEPGEQLPAEVQS
jgi:hypothetical protein